MVSLLGDHVQLISTLEDWTKILDDGECVDAIYMDLKKAFDSVPHQRLLAKLKGYGIKGKLLKWIETFLTCRKHCVGSSKWGTTGQCPWTYSFNDLTNVNGSWMVRPMTGSAHADRWFGLVDSAHADGWFGPFHCRY